jgi:hypothetical protein
MASMYRHHRISSIPRCERIPARRIGWLPSIVKSKLLIPANRSTKDWSDAVISSIKCDVEFFDFDETVVPKIAWTTRHDCLSTLGWFRKFGKLSDARQTSDQLIALAEGLAVVYPKLAGPLLLLSEGYTQKAKNSYRETEDSESIVKQWQQRALEALKRAAAIEPSNDEVHEVLRPHLARMEQRGLNQN